MHICAVFHITYEETVQSTLYSWHLDQDKIEKYV